MKKTPKPKGGSDKARASRAVGDALRDAYEQALSEGVPDDMLDLLKKLD